MGKFMSTGQPENILVDKSGKMKISDFGLARESSNSMSMVNTVAGSPYYVAPEIRKHLPYDKSVDTFSLGTSLLPKSWIAKIVIVGSRPCLRVHHSVG